MAVNWNLKYTIGAGTTSLNFATRQASTTPPARQNVSVALTLP